MPQMTTCSSWIVQDLRQDPIVKKMSRIPRGSCIGPNRILHGIAKEDLNTLSYQDPRKSQSSGEKEFLRDQLGTSTSQLIYGTSWCS